jgi:ABC-2 type transport system ATP-binding protein
MSQAMIRVDELTKDYGSQRAVDHISFEVRTGEVLGFLGPNGAGKTTTMKILTCFMAPTSGSAQVAGYDVFDASLEVRQRIGYLPEDTPLYRDMLVFEYLSFVAEIRGVDPATRRDKIKAISEVCGITSHLGRPIAELSKGYRQRVGLAQAMVHDPQILILDEPTSGLDPNQIVEIRSLIKEIGKQKTVILSTHILPEVQATCSRVVIISSGKLVADGTPDELSARERGNRYSIIVEAGGPAEAVQAKLSSISGVARCERQQGTNGAFEFLVDARASEDLRRPLFRAAVDNGWTLLELARRSASLEDVFRKLTQEDPAAAQARAEAQVAARSA